MGANTWYQPPPSFSKVYSVAVVLAALGASTTITCCALPVSAIWSTRSGLMYAPAEPKNVASPKLKIPPSEATSQ